MQKKQYKTKNKDFISKIVDLENHIEAIIFSIPLIIILSIWRFFKYLFGVINKE